MRKRRGQLLVAAAFVAAFGCNASSDDHPPSPVTSAPDVDGGTDPGPIADAGTDDADAAPPFDGYVPAPTLAGGPDLVGPFDVNLGLDHGGVIPGIYAPNEGAFRFICGGEGQILYDDPIVYPLQPGRSHLHKFSGPSAADAFTTNDLLRTMGNSNCNYGQYTLNHSLYWMPAVVDDQNRVHNPDVEVFYYKRLRSSAPECHPESYDKALGTCLPMPNSIRMVFGWNMNDVTAPVQGMSWYCATGGDGQHHADLDELFNSGCAVGAQAIADLAAPGCWDGKYLDTPTHRSHMAYPSYGDWGYAKCPATHPYVLPGMETKKFFTITADMVGTNPDNTKYSRVHCSSDGMMPGAKACATMHADYWEAWDARVKKMWTDNCIDLGLNCNSGDLGNGYSLKGAAQPAYGWTNPNPTTPVPTMPGM